MSFFEEQYLHSRIGKRLLDKITEHPTFPAPKKKISEADIIFTKSPDLKNVYRMVLNIDQNLGKHLQRKENPGYDERPLKDAKGMIGRLMDYLDNEEINFGP